MDDHQILRRDATIRSVLLGLLVLVTALTVVLSKRPLFLGDRWLVLPGAPIAASALPPGFMTVVDNYGVHIPKLSRRPLLSLEPAAAAPEPYFYPDATTPLRFGYSIREKNAAGMPFWATPEHGHVIYYEAPREYVVTLVTDDYLRQMKIASPLLDDGDYSFWPYRWGWLFVIAGLGIVAFEFTALRRRRAVLGLI